MHLIGHEAVSPHHQAVFLPIRRQARKVSWNVILAEDGGLPLVAPRDDMRDDMDRANQAPTRGDDGPWGGSLADSLQTLQIVKISKPDPTPPALLRTIRVVLFRQGSR
jgi:hypothetical protein